MPTIYAFSPSFMFPSVHFAFVVLTMSNFCMPVHLAPLLLGKSLFVAVESPV
jgi:hypothetical protein